jgi:hypothetical protein
MSNRERVPTELNNSKSRRWLPSSTGPESTKRGVDPLPAESTECGRDKQTSLNFGDPGPIGCATCTIFRIGSVPGVSGTHRGPGGPEINRKTPGPDLSVS